MIVSGCLDFSIRTQGIQELMIIAIEIPGGSKREPLSESLLFLLDDSLK